MDNRPNRTTSADSQSNRRKQFYGLLGIVALIVAITFAGNALFPGANSTSYAQSNSATPTANPTTAALTSEPTQPPTTPNSGSSPQPGAKATQNGQYKDKGSERGEQGGQRGASGTISAISGNTLTLKQGNVIVIQATLNPNTVYIKAGQTITQNDLKVGQLATVRTTTASDGSVSISMVEVQLNRAGGTISTLDASSLTLTRSNNTAIKVALTSATSYLDLGKNVSLSDLKAGLRVEVAGTLNADGSLNAEIVTIQHDQLAGTVTAINGTNLTIQSEGKGRGEAQGKGKGTTTPASGTTTSSNLKTITVTSNTSYLAGGQAIQLSNLAVGDKIEAVGTLSSDRSSLSALQVTVELPHYGGQVSSVTGTTIVIQDRSGTHTTEVNGTTKYLNGQTNAALSDVKVGVSLSAEGKVDASGKMTATLIQLGQPQEAEGSER